MSRFWNGKDLDQETPELGLRLESAALIPEFSDQLLESGLCAEIERLSFTPLDDLKAWLRLQNPGEVGDLHELRDLLLSGEEAEATKAAAEGRRFDLVDYELSMMAADETYEQFNKAWAHRIFKVLVEEADSLEAWSQKELGNRFSMSMSFHLPEPRKHEILQVDAIEEALKRFGADAKLQERLLKGRGKTPELSGLLLLEFFGRGLGQAPKGNAETAFVSISMRDPRLGDLVDAVLSFGYPKSLEGYFLLSFDQLRKQLTLKDEA